jgi:ubiquinone biosynthesis protein UbiJ
VTEDRRHATTERITALTDEIGTTAAQLIMLWPWQRMKARILAAHLGKLYSDLHAELGGRATSMAARAVTRPLEMMMAKLDEAIARLDETITQLIEIGAKVDAVTARVDTLERRLDALEAGGE